MTDTELAEFLERLAMRLRNGEVSEGDVKFRPDMSIREFVAYEVSIQVKPRNPQGTKPYQEM